MEIHKLFSDDSKSSRKMIFLYTKCPKESQNFDIGYFGNMSFSHGSIVEHVKQQRGTLLRTRISGYTQIFFLRFQVQQKDDIFIHYIHSRKSKFQIQVVFETSVLAMGPQSNTLNNKERLCYNQRYLEKHRLSSDDSTSSRKMIFLYTKCTEKSPNFNFGLFWKLEFQPWVHS